MTYNGLRQHHDSIRRAYFDASNRCNLECPGCGRTLEKNAGTMSELHDWTIEEFDRFLILNPNLRMIDFNSAMSDAPADRYFYERFISRENHHPNLNFLIHTNGCSASTKTWEKVAHKLIAGDRIVWSVDGLDQDTNVIYRVNSKFDLIQENMRLVNRIIDERGLKNDITSTLKFVVFAHNFDQMYQVRDTAISLGCTSFTILESDNRTPKQMRLTNEQSGQFKEYKRQLSTV
jgi:MoaA/NifB/PqqE/SkfB family radical SAM enzyme